MTAKAVKITAKEEAKKFDQLVDETIDRYLLSSIGMTKEEAKIIDRQIDERLEAMLEARNNPEKKIFTLPPEQARIIQKIDEVVDWDSLTRRSIFDISAQIYNIGYGDGFEAAKESVDDWLDRPDFCQGGH